MSKENAIKIRGANERERERESKSPRLSSLLKSLLSFVVFVSFFLLSHTSVYATTYYVANAGNDSCDGTSQTIGSSGVCAWKTIAKVNASSFLAGDSISFNKGDTWREQLNIPSSGSSGSPITFNSYGSGNKPKIYGSTVPSSWTSESYAPTYTISKVQGPPTIGTGTTSVTSTFASTPTQNNLLIAWLGCTGSTAGISSAAISGFSLANSGIEGTGNGFISIWYKVAGAGESTGVTATITGGVGCNLIVEEWTNLATSTPLDKTAKTDDTGGTVSSRSSGTTPTTTVASELAVAGVMTGSTTTSKSWSNSFTSEYSNDSFNIVTSSKIVSSTGAYESTLSWTTARRAGGTIATFKGLSGATTQLYYTSQSADPGYMWFIDTGGAVHKGNKVASKDLLLSDYDWWFDSVNSRLYINSATDPLTRYSSVEVVDATKNTGIFWTGSGESYITVDGFEVAFVAGPGIVNRGDYWTITNNTIHHLGDRTPTGHSYGIELQTTNYTRVANNIVHDTLASCVYIVTSYTPFINTNNTIESNTLYDCLNTMLLANTENTHGTNVFNSTIIRYNNMYHSSSFSLGTGNGMGIQLVGSSGGFPVDSYQIYYNTISVKKKGISLGDYVTNTNVYNNSILANGSGAGSGMGIYVSGTGNSGITIKNNLVADAGLYGLDVVDKTAISALDYNLWYAPTGTGYANVNGTNYTSGSFATYKSDTGWDTNGYWQNPLIISTSTPDFHLQPTSPVIDKGTNVSLTTDYAGTTVPQGSAQDIGAYEYIPLTVTINQKSDQADPTNSSTINFTVVFSETVSDFATGDVTLSGTSGATTGTVTGSGTAYNVAVTGMTGSGTVIASLAAGVATGATGNTNAVSTSTDNTVTYDITPPTLTSITISDTSGYTNSATPTITIVSSGSPSHVAFSCNGGTNYSSWIAYADSISSFNITNGATGCTTSDGNKTITAKLKDAATNESGTANDSTYYDTTAPTLSSKTTFSGWYTANQTSTFTYSDGSGSGIASGTPVTCSITTEGSAQTCSITPNVCDALGNCNTTLVTSNGANIDKTAPSTGSITYTDGYFTSASVPLTVDDGTDGGSGINTATRTFQRQSASLLLGICGIYGSFSPITPTPNPGYPSFTDTTVVSGNCYKYEYQVSDTAGNQATYTSVNAARIDTSNPSTPGTPSTTNPNNSSSQNWTWIAATDAISDVANYLWRTTGTAVASGSSAVNSLTTTLGDGLYSFFVKAVDTAGNQGSESSVSNIRIDTTAPSVPGTPTTASLTTVNKPVWTWTSSADSGSGLAATPYSVQWCGNSSFTGCDANTDTASTNTYTHATALADGTWYFRVKATDTANNSSAYSSNGTDTINTVTTTTTSNSNSSSNNTSSTSTPSCTDQAPAAKAPWLYGAIAQDSGSVLLYFTEADNPVNKYVLEYGTKSGDYPYGVQDMGVNTRGQMTYLVKSLSPNTTYYFKVRGGNGCATGTWSNEISAKTKSNVEINQLNFTSSTLETVPAEETQPTTTSESCQTYTVKSGDTLWSIAKNLLGDGNRYKEIVEQNKATYSSLENSNSVVKGWELKVNCGNKAPVEPPKTPTTETMPPEGYDVKIKVVDTEKKPVEGASVTLHSTPQTTITDKNGIASFKNVEAGDHKVLIAYNNFEGEQSINLTGDVKEFDLNVTVQQKAISLSSLAYGIIGIMGLVIIGLIVLVIKLKRKE